MTEHKELFAELVDCVGMNHNDFLASCCPETFVDPWYRGVLSGMHKVNTTVKSFCFPDGGDSVCCERCHFWDMEQILDDKAECLHPEAKKFLGKGDMKLLTCDAAFCSKFIERDLAAGEHLGEAGQCPN